ncbi:phospholipase B1, membrane-associated [Poeciliopsis prolifica]|uniref:phospholipase B1, membrane-associated n=1 Tax=Poeciliopsis prolifica TaxID=188132 RepID=UPI002413711A|nr:phospholipase B1, membrane-associated [Poeciliopsis prolifica]
MEALLIGVVCALLSCSVKGDDWWGEYQEGIRQYSDEDLNKMFLEKTRPLHFKHPPFQCPDMTPSPTVPSSVEFVKAADIKVIAALGDSMTTAVGANASSVKALPEEFRHVSWSIGGYGTFQDVITLANIIKLFNPTLIGASLGKTTYGIESPFNETGFNLAVTGHNTFQLPNQTRKLIDTLRQHKGLNFAEDWKLLTILIGMNDICDYCKDKSQFSVDNFIRYLTLSLEMLKKEVPRMIVNVVQILRISFLREVKKPTEGCNLQEAFCGCLIKPGPNSPELKELIEVNLKFQKSLEKLFYSNRFFKKDFAVVLQPFTRDADAPRLPNGTIDMTFFAPDCFHITIKGHEELAKGLWNNMFQPGNRKTIVSKLSEPLKLICPPQDHPYIFTQPVAAKSSPSLLRSKSTSPAAVVLILLVLLLCVA